MSTPALSQPIEVRPWRLRGGKAVLLWLGCFLFLAAILVPLVASDEDTHYFGWDEALGVLGACFVLSLATVGGAYLTHRERPDTSYLRLEPDAVTWHWPPVPPVGVPYGELWSAQREGRGRNERLILRTRQKGSIDLRIRDFSDPALVDPLLEDILERVRALPDGPRLYEEISKRRALAALTQRPILTICIMAVLVLVFLLEVAAGAFEDDPARILALGANSAERVADGELFRLATANLLHGSPGHLLMNIVVLFAMGALLEPLLGRSRFLLIFLGSCLGGAAASALVAQHSLSVGASTGISGVIGAYAVIRKRWPNLLPYPPSRGDWIRLAWAFVFPALVIRNVDNAGHLGGLAAGVLLMLASSWKSDLLELRNRHRLASRVAAGVLLAVFLASSAMVARQFLDGL